MNGSKMGKVLPSLGCRSCRAGSYLGCRDAVENFACIKESERCQATRKIVKTMERELKQQRIWVWRWGGEGWAGTSGWEQWGIASAC